MTVSPNLAKNILSFMQRSELKGNEVSAYNEITQLLTSVVEGKVKLVADIIKPEVV